MKIFLCASRHNYGKLQSIVQALQNAGHVVTPPNSFDKPEMEDGLKSTNPQEHIQWKADMIRLDKQKIAANDAILVMNFEKNGIPNYIGGATFLEIYMAFDLNRKIFLWNPIPEGMLRDEITGLAPVVIDGDITKIKS